jgi:methylated-DNA-protein-cysteine methyltransferase-like protein
MGLGIAGTRNAGAPGRRRVSGARADALAAPVYARIYAAIRRVPRGRVCTYGEIARAAAAGGPRQVGFALRHSFAARLPWHRILNAAGAMRAPGESSARQRVLLHAEGVEFSARGKVDLQRYGWVARVP